MEFEPEFRGSSSEISDQKNENGDYLYLDLEESDMDSMVGKLSNGNEVIGLVESDESRKCGEDCKNLYEGEECMISGSSVFSNRKRKRGCRWRMLDWVVEVAKNPCDPEVGLLPERPDWKQYGREQLWKQVLLARHALFLKRNGNRSPEQKISNWLVCLKSSSFLSYDDSLSKCFAVHCKVLVVPNFPSFCMKLSLTKMCLCNRPFYLMVYPTTNCFTFLLKIISDLCCLSCCLRVPLILSTCVIYQIYRLKECILGD